MQKFDGTSQMYGEITDVNVWDRILDLSDLRCWSNCSKQLNGTLVNWRSLSQGNFFNVDPTLSLKQMKENEVCSGKNSYMYYDIMSDNKTFSFPPFPSVEYYYQFCSSIGGKVATTSSEEKLQTMIEAVSNPIRKIFLTGYCGNAQNEWLDINYDTPFPETLSKLLQDFGSDHSEGKCLWYNNGAFTPVSVKSSGIIPFCEIQPKVFVLRFKKIIDFTLIKIKKYLTF